MKKIYLISLQELGDESVFQEAFEKLDSTRKEKVLKCANEKDRLQSLGAGLLLQYAFQTVGKGEEKSDTSQWEILTWAGIKGHIRDGVEHTYYYNDAGKPYLENVSDSKELNLYFSLSHSGEFVICAISDSEIGADIQQMKHVNYDKIISRFFTPIEYEHYSQINSQEEKISYFYKLWTRKEAYAKCTGKGLAGILQIDVLQDNPAFVWDEYEAIDGYKIAVCRNEELGV